MGVYHYSELAVSANPRMQRTVELTSVFGKKTLLFKDEQFGHARYSRFGGTDALRLGTGLLGQPFLTNVRRAMKAFT